MVRRIAAGILYSIGLGIASASAADCSPRCDYWHYYGPYDFSYVSPGLIGYPVCDRQGNCSPSLIYVHPSQPYRRITIRPLGHARP